MLPQLAPVIQRMHAVHLALFYKLLGSLHYVQLHREQLYLQLALFRLYLDVAEYRHLYLKL